MSDLVSAPLREIANVKAKTESGIMTLDEYIRQSEMQGIIVLQHGKVVYERYPRMAETDKHIYFSLSKVVVSAAIGILENEGRLSTAAPIGKYLPQLNKSDWGKVKVIDILNMTTGMTGLQFDDPAAQTDSDNVYFRFASHMGLARKTGAIDTGIWDILNTMKRQKAPGIAFEYSSVNTVILSLLVEEITGKRFTDFITEQIWQKIGAGSDAYIGLSADGIVSTSAMMNSTLRDLARFGLLFSPSWHTVSKEKIIPDAYLENLREKGAVAAAYDKGWMGRKIIQDLNERPDHNAYQWDGIMADGDFFKSGMNGQGLYVSPSRDLVIACFAHNKASSIVWLRAIATSGLFDPQPATGPQQDSVVLSSILGAYYEIKDALTGSDADAAATKARSFVKALDNVAVGSLSGGQKEAFIHLAPKLKEDAERFEAAKALDRQRDLFADLSDDLYALAVATPLSGQPIYREYCPMKQAYWLSKDMPIRNPYFGNQMLTCGKVTETLK
jgi:hypothetical protein